MNCGDEELVVTVVIVSVDNEHDARSTWLAHAVKQKWRDDGYRVRVMLHQVKDDGCVVGLLTAAVLPKLNGPVVIMRGNTTAIFNTDLSAWIQRWVASDVSIWCTAVDTTSAFQRWYVNVVGRGMPPVASLKPVWGVFSGISTALQTALLPYAGSGENMEDVLRRLVATGDVYLDSTPLIDVGLHNPSDVVENTEKLRSLWISPPLWTRTAWGAKMAVRSRDGVLVTVAVLLIFLLTCVVIGLSAAAASKRASSFKK